MKPRRKQQHNNRPNRPVEKQHIDKATLLGLGSGLLIVIGAMALGSSLSQFVSLSGLLIVVGGTLAATLTRFSLGQFGSAIKVATHAFVQRPESPHELINIAKRQARVMRDRGRLALDREVVTNTFFRKGLLLCADGCSPEYIRRVLGEEIALTQERHETGQHIFRSIGETAPAFGIIGTLVGLVQMLGNMADPSTIGPSMSLALLTTLYGALIAHVVAIPIADKLELRSAEERTNKILIMEGIISIQNGQHPHVLGELLEAFVPKYLRPSAQPDPRKAA